jgi:hypothetical protein
MTKPFDADGDQECRDIREPEGHASSALHCRKASLRCIKTLQRESSLHICVQTGQTGDHFMAAGSQIHFEARGFGRLSTANDDRRFRMEFVDAEGAKVVVSLPVVKAVEMACLICDLSENAPYLVGGVRHRGQGLSRR